MPKKPTGYSKSGKGKPSPIAKNAVPDQTPTLKANTLPIGNKPPGGMPKSTVPEPMNGGANAVAKLPNTLRITRPAKLAPRKPTI